VFAGTAAAGAGVAATAGVAAMCLSHCITPVDSSWHCHFDWQEWFSDVAVAWHCLLVDSK
jgi:hypothetical protein